MILKIAGGVLIVICGSLCGIYFSGATAKKAEFISQYISFLNHTEAMICFACADIYRILSEQSGLPLMNRMFGEIKTELESGHDFTSSWSSAVHNAYERKEFEKEDLPLLLSFAEGFGELGPDEESGRLRLLCRSAQERLSEIEKELSGRKKLYRTLGVFFGILAAVIII